MTEAIHSVVLAEGESDRQAILATALKFERDLSREGVDVIAMGGATNVERYAHDLERHDVDVFGLCDSPELRYFERVMESQDIYICRDDLEDELIRCMGIDQMVAFIESQGEIKRFRTMQKQPQQRDLPIEHHVHRFCGIRSGRKVRYARGMVEWLPIDRLPDPLTSLIHAL